MKNDEYNQLIKMDNVAYKKNWKNIVVASEPGTILVPFQLFHGIAIRTFVTYLVLVNFLAHLTVQCQYDQYFGVFLLPEFLPLSGWKFLNIVGGDRKRLKPHRSPVMHGLALVEIFGKPGLKRIRKQYLTPLHAYGKQQPINSHNSTRRKQMIGFILVEVSGGDPN